MVDTQSVRRSYTLFSEYLGEDWQTPETDKLDEYLLDKMELEVFPLEDVGKRILYAYIIWDKQNGVPSLVCSIEECDGLPWISDVLERLADAKNIWMQPREVAAILKEFGFENEADLREE